MLKATGFTDADLAKPLVGVATTWIETMPCNLNQRLLANYVKQGIRAAGGTPMEFNTIAVSDGVSMGTTGMRASLVSRDLIADSIELVARGHLFDGLVCLVGCDKTIPAAVMALARLDIPGLVLYGGSIAPGRYRGKDVTIQDVFEVVGAHAAGQGDRERGARARERRVPRRGRLRRPLHREHDGDGARLPRRQLAGAERDPRQPSGQAAGGRRGPASSRCSSSRDDTRPSQVLTRASIENAIAAIAGTGGSTNGVLHLLAIAREAGIELSIDDFDTISAKTPLVADIKPGGRFVATDLFRRAASSLIARELVARGRRRRDRARRRRAHAARGRGRRVRAQGPGGRRALGRSR